VTLLDSTVYDTVRAKKRRNRILAVVGLAVAIAIAVFLSWNLPAEHRVNEFFAAIQAHNLPKAYGIWNNDPNWEQHAERYATAGYSYGRFQNDWGADGDYGTITRHKIVHATSRYGNTTLVVVDVNGRKAAPLTLAVAKHTHAMTFPPFTLTPMPNGFGWTVWNINYP
jgi:hypothetical protein